MVPNQVYIVYDKWLSNDDWHLLLIGGIGKEGEVEKRGPIFSVGQLFSLAESMSRRVLWEPATNTQLNPYS
jgi:hypothetical protein